MDYEKRYNDALKRVKAVIDTAADKDLVKGIASTIFPELCESEDERIRKELIMAFEAYDVESSWNGLPVKSILAWLEKQKTYKPTEEDERKRKMLIETIDSIENFPNKGVAIAYLEKQKPQDTVGSVSVEIRSNLQKDEVVRKTLIMLVDAGRISVTGAITNSDIRDWLEGQKGQKLAAWRPTEADINLLRRAIDGTKIEPYEWEQLEGIFVGLTKAQEEKK